MLAAKSMYFVNPRCEHVHVPTFVMLIYSIFQLCSGGPKMFSKSGLAAGYFHGYADPLRSIQKIYFIQDPSSSSCLPASEHLSRSDQPIQNVSLKKFRSPQVVWGLTLLFMVFMDSNP